MSDFNEWEQTLFQLILHAGNKVGVMAFQMPLERINNLLNSDTGLGKTGELLLVGSDEQTQAHKINTSIITKAARGEDVPFSVLLVHSLDLLMLAWAEIDNTEQVIRMNKRIEALEKEVAKCQNPQSKK